MSTSAPYPYSSSGQVPHKSPTHLGSGIVVIVCLSRWAGKVLAQALGSRGCVVADRALDTPSPRCTMRVNFALFAGHTLNISRLEENWAFASVWAASGCWLAVDLSRLVLIGAVRTP